MNLGSFSLDNIFMVLIIAAIFIFIVRLIFGSIKKIMGLIINSIVGAIGLLLVNYFGAAFGISVGINLFTAVIAGIFGVPGVILLVIFQNFM